MREILFRGKSQADGEWVYGYYSPARLPIVGEIGHFINEDGYRAIEVIPETVGQFTGLTDKNGTKIFEGDIVKSNLENQSLMSIEWLEDSSQFATVWNNGGCVMTFDYIEPTDIEVIGNIHDNPELLGGDGDEG